MEQLMDIEYKSGVTIKGHKNFQTNYDTFDTWEEDIKFITPPLEAANPQEEKMVKFINWMYSGKNVDFLNIKLPDQRELLKKVMPHLVSMKIANDLDIKRIRAPRNTFGIHAKTTKEYKKRKKLLRNAAKINGLNEEVISFVYNEYLKSFLR